MITYINFFFNIIEILLLVWTLYSVRKIVEKLADDMTEIVKNRDLLDDEEINEKH